MEEQYILELTGKIEISHAIEFETGKPKLMVVYEDPNGLDQYLLIEELIIGKTKVIPYKF